MAVFQTYAKILSRYPGIVCFGCILISSGLTIIAFLYTDLPDFSDPTEGFNTTGTEISDKLRVFRSLQDEIGYGKRFHQFPNEVDRGKMYDSQPKNRPKIKGVKVRKHGKKNRTKTSFQGHRFVHGTGRCNFTDGESGYICDTIDGHDPSFFDNEPGFCRMELSDKWAVVAFEVDQLVTWSTFNALCAVEEMFWRRDSHLRLLSADQFCLPHARPGTCCQPWHFASLTAAYLGESHCSDVKEKHFRAFEEKYRRCKPSRSKIMECWESWGAKFENLTELDDTPILHFMHLCDSNLEVGCTSYDFHTLLAFLSPMVDDQKNVHKNVTLMILPLHKDHALSTRLLSNSEMRLDFLNDLNHQLESMNASFARLRLVGADLGVKNELFLDHLLNDTYYGFVAFMVVLGFVWIFTQSFWFTVCVAYMVGASLGVGYFFYRVVIFMDFFPFVNLLTLVLMVGLGADDAFVYWTAWQKSKSTKKTLVLDKLVQEALSHTASVMFVTSLTTAVAFLTNLLSKIYVLQCFGIFACLAISVNFILSVTFLPACVVMLDFGVNMGPFETAFNRLDCRGTDLYKRGTDAVFRYRERFASIYCRKFFESCLPYLVVRFRYFWPVLLTTVTVLSATVIFYGPGLRLPDEGADYFQYFHSTHPFEKWDGELKHNFRLYSGKVGEDGPTMPIRIVWGVEPRPAVSHTVLVRNPNRTVDTVVQLWPDGSFNLGSDPSLEFLEKFCYKLRDFAVPNAANGSWTVPVLLPYCFVPDFMQWMAGPCTDPAGADRKPCCKDEPRPYPRTVFETCLKRALSQFTGDFDGQFSSDRYAVQFARNGPFFDHTGKYRVLTVSYPSNYTLTASYEKMRQFYERADGWIKKQLEAGPADVINGWFVSDWLEFYDLQRSLLQDTKWAILLAVGVAFLAIFATTCSLLVSLACVWTISTVILSTVALMVLYDWKLNVIESTIIILTVGLSFDYTLHYASAYLDVMKSARAVGHPTTNRRRASSTTPRPTIGSSSRPSIHRSPRPSSASSSLVAFHSPAHPLDAHWPIRLALTQSGAPIFCAALTTLLAGACVLPAQTLAYSRVGVFMITVTVVSWTHATFFLCPLLSWAEQCRTSLSAWSAFRRYVQLTTNPTNQNMSVPDSMALRSHRASETKNVGAVRRASIPVLRVSGVGRRSKDHDCFLKRLGSNP